MHGSCKLALGVYRLTYTSFEAATSLKWTRASEQWKVTCNAFCEYMHTHTHTHTHTHIYIYIYMSVTYNIGNTKIVSLRILRVSSVDYILDLRGRPSVLGEPAASIFTVTQLRHSRRWSLLRHNYVTIKMGASCPSEMSMSAYWMWQRYIFVEGEV
jgi:hypothetical protein